MLLLLLSTRSSNILIYLFFLFITRGFCAYGRNQALNPGCVIDPKNPEAHFRLLDPQDGIPFVNVGGKMRKSPEIIDPIPEYHFTHSEGTSDSFDLVHESSFVALFDSGIIGFVGESSNGSHPAVHDGDNYITSIFTITCDGTITMRLPDAIQCSFSYHSPDQSIFAIPKNPQVLPRGRTSAFHLFHRRTQEAKSLLVTESKPFTFLTAPILTKSRALSRRDENGLNHMGDSWEPFTFLAGPLKVSDHFQIGYSPRCPATPFGLQSSVRPDARAAGFNGCGADNGMKFPDFRFTVCCNNHDLCYDNCGMTWEDCNDNFRQCMFTACHDYYKDTPLNASAPESNKTTWSEWGCNGLAETYADAVGTRIGAWAFSIANTERCGCNCPTGTSNCTDLCLKDCGDRCGIVDCDAEAAAAAAAASSASAGWGFFNSGSKTTSSSSVGSSSTTATKGTTTLSSIKTTTTASSTTSVTSVTTSATATSTGGSWWWPFGGSSKEMATTTPVAVKVEPESGYTMPEKPPKEPSWWSWLFG